jgi:sporulation protein YlmC with PRC-barrel domain
MRYDSIINRRRDISISLADSPLARLVQDRGHPGSALGVASQVLASLAAVALAAALLIWMVPRPALSQAAVQLIQVDVKAVAQGYRASKLRGTNVVNDKDEKVGDIDDIVVGRDKKLIFTVIEVGGFLGIGGRLVAVPFDQLNIDETGSKITLPGASREELRKLPEFRYST